MSAIFSSEKKGGKSLDWSWKLGMKEFLLKKYWSKIKAALINEILMNFEGISFELCHQER